jgi:hypothetical protein
VTEHDETASNAVGYTTRDLVIQANTKLDNFVVDLKEVRTEVAALRVDVDALKTEEAVRDSRGGVTTDLRRAIYAVLVLLAYWFGPVIDKAITH